MPLEPDDSVFSIDNAKECINFFLSNPEHCGFEVYICKKTSPKLKKMSFVESRENNLRIRMKEVIFSLIQEKYLSDESEYSSIENIGNNQHKHYIIQTDVDYNPFDFINNSEIENFQKDDIADSTGILYLIRKDDKKLWAYQHLWSILIPNKSNKNFLGRIITRDKKDIFEELQEPILTFAKKIDLLLVYDHIVTDNINLLQQYFNFQTFLSNQLNQVIQKIENLNIVSNIDEIKSYINSCNGKSKYAKKLLRIKDSEVLNFSLNDLKEKILNSTRWKDKINIENDQFVLGSSDDVKNLIDFLDERYTRSDITNTEYDTDVKKKAESH